MGFDSGSGRDTFFLSVFFSGLWPALKNVLHNNSNFLQHGLDAKQKTTQLSESSEIKQAIV